MDDKLRNLKRIYNSTGSRDDAMNYLIALNRIGAIPHETIEGYTGEDIGGLVLLAETLSPDIWQIILTANVDSLIDEVIYNVRNPKAIYEKERIRRLAESIERNYEDEFCGFLFDEETFGLYLRPISLDMTELELKWEKASTKPYLDCTGLELLRSDYFKI